MPETHGAPEEALDSRALRDALGRFATGVTVVTCVDADGAPAGLTVNSFGSLSLEPPLVLWSLRSASPSLPAFAGATHFVVNVLAEAQVELSRRFASRLGDKFAEVAWAPGLGGAPILEGCVAAFECETVARQTWGDHELFIGQVHRFEQAALAPLLFQAGRYRVAGKLL